MEVTQVPLCFLIPPNPLRELASVGQDRKGGRGLCLQGP